MNINTVEAGDLAVEAYIVKRTLEGCTCYKATEYQDKHLGFDVIVIKPDGSIEYVDVKNRSHNICGRLIFETGRFHGRKPFAQNTYASHVYIADEDKQVTIIEYLSEFVVDYNKLHLLRKCITELESVDFRKTLETYDVKQLNAKIMPYKNRLTAILKYPWEFEYDKFACLKTHRAGAKEYEWHTMYRENDKGSPIVDWSSNQLTFALNPTGRSNPMTNEKLEKKTDSLTSALETTLNKNKKDVSQSS